jgi:hypothetical protein
MAIAYDNSASGSTTGGTVAYTTASGASMFVVTDVNCTAVSYNSVSLTNVIDYTPAISDGNGNRVKIWYLESPASGSNNISFTVSSGTIAWACATYTGVSPSQPEANTTNTPNNGTNNIQVASTSTSVTTLTNNAWVVVFIVGDNNSPQTFTAGASTTLRTSYGSLSSRSIGILDSNGTVSPAGSRTLNINWSSGSGFVSTVIVSVAPKFVSSGGFMPYFI